MKKKSLIITIILSIVALFIASPLFVKQTFWKNWQMDRAYVDVIAQGHNSIEAINMSKGLSVEYLSQSNNQSVMRIKVKTGISNRKNTVAFKILKTGRVVFDFYPQHTELTRDASIKNGQLIFKNIMLSEKSLETNYSQEITAHSDEIMTLSFQVKEYFDAIGLLAQYIDWYIFIIALSLAFFSIYKIVRYLAEFKLQSGSSRIDIVFVSFFAILLLLPILRISQDDVSDQENRTLARIPHIYNETGLNLNYGQEFEKWFNDHFFGRESLILFNNYIHHHLSQRGNANILIGQDDWLYNADNNVIRMFQNIDLFSETELEEIGHRLQNFVQEAKAKGVQQVYFYLANDKESLYPEFYPSYITKLNSISRLEQMISYIHKNYPEIKIFNFKDSLEKVKQTGEVLYCKTGSHMNNMGSYYEYKFLMQEIQKDYPNLSIVGLNDLNIKEEYACDVDFYNMLNDPTYSRENLKNKALQIKSPKASEIVNRLRFDKRLGSVSAYVNPNVDNHLSALLVSDSFGWIWRQYLAESFASVYDIFNGHGMNYSFFDDELKYIREHRPDIIIVESTERYLQRFKFIEFPEI